MIDDLLRSNLANKSKRVSLNASLALLPVDAEQVYYLLERLLNAEPKEVLVIRDALTAHQETLRDKLWAFAENTNKVREVHRLRAAAALATYDPKNAKWSKTGQLVIDDLVQENPVHLLYWREAFRPVKESLLAPLGSVFRDQRPERSGDRNVATSLLTDYAADNADVLADLLMDADEKQFDVIFMELASNRGQALTLLTAELDKKLPADMPSADEKRERLAKRQANAAVALLRLGQAEKVWPLLKRTPPDDPRVRSNLIHRLSPLRADAGAIIKRLDDEPDISVRRALLLSLGEFSERDLPANTRTALLQRLQEIYGQENDPGLHAAVAWLLRRWKQADWLKQVDEEWAKNGQERNHRFKTIQQQIKASQAASATAGPPQWYVNSQGQTMVVIPGPVEFWMGSPSTEADHQAIASQHKRRIGRTFALAAAPVTVHEFGQFLKENQLGPWFERGQAALLMKLYSPDENGPAVLVDWYRAAAYCNWLSQRDGISEDQWCYETNVRQLSQAKVSVFGSLLLPHHALAKAASTSYFFFLLDEQPEVTALKRGYLSLRGYRLPTEAEFEYACRAGAVTSRYYGETEDLLSQYGWYLKNSNGRTWPAGGKKPNDFGLFDMHGNVYNWCQESYKGGYAVSKEGERIENVEDNVAGVSTDSRVLRGDGFHNDTVGRRSAWRLWNVPWNRLYDVGFRPARTFTPSPLSCFALTAKGR
jgi:formylglycine-generating enzyme required for sulfatase activity